MVVKKQIVLKLNNWVLDTINKKLDERGHQKIGRGYPLFKLLKTFLNNEKNIDLIKKYVGKKHTTVRVDTETEKKIKKIVEELGISKNKLISTIYTIFATDEKKLDEVLKESTKEN